MSSFSIDQRSYLQSFAKHCVGLSWFTRVKSHGTTECVLEDSKVIGFCNANTSLSFDINVHSDLSTVSDANTHRERGSSRYNDGTLISILWNVWQLQRPQVHDRTA